MKIARLVNQLCYYTDFRALFLKTIKCGEWVVYVEKVTIMNREKNSHSHLLHPHI